MKRALLNIDYTNDFVAKDGALTCGVPAQNIESNIIELTKAFIKEKSVVIFAIDLHNENDPYHPETDLYPPHNIDGTKGRELYGGLKAIFENASEEDGKYMRWIDKTRYSAFAGTDLAIYLRSRGVEEVHICGVATDICCLHTAIDAYNLGYRIVIHSNAVASFNPIGHEWALQHFEKALGAKVIY